MSDFLNRMKSAAKADLKTIVLPEGEDPRTIVAATKIIEEGLAKIVILGNPDEINVPGATVIDPRNAEKHEEYAQKFAELRAKKGVTIEQARAQVMDATYFGTMMVKMGDADGLVSGACHSTADTLRPGTGTLLRTPNNILGIEYCKAILHRHAALTPLALPRLGAAHGGGAGAHAGTPMASASFLRGLPQPDWEPFVPARAAELYGRAAADGLLLDGARLETAVLALLRMQDPANFAQVRGVSEGLENRLTAAVREADSLDDLYTRLKTKRYPHARLRRLVLDAALGFPAELPMPPYLHVLGARKAALPRLKQASLPAATALADLARTGPEAAKISRLHNKAVDFSSLCREKIQPMGLAFTAKPVVI